MATTEDQGPVDLDAELQAMTDGKLVNDVQIRIIPSLLRKGEHPDDVLKLVVDETMARVGDRLAGPLKGRPATSSRVFFPRTGSSLKTTTRRWACPPGCPASFMKPGLIGLRQDTAPTSATTEAGSTSASSRSRSRR